MHISKVPPLLFEDFSAKFGIGPEPGWLGSEGYYQTMRRELRDTLGAIGLVRDPQQSVAIFRYYTGWPIDDFDFSYAVQVIAKPKEAGLWVAHQGAFIHEVVEAKMTIRGLNLQVTNSLFAVYVLAQAAQLCHEKKPFGLMFWENDRDARSSFDSPPD